MTAPNMNAPSFEKAGITGDHVSSQALPTRADITFHIMADTIPALGIVGAADVAERACSADVTVEGILKTLAGASMNSLVDVEKIVTTLSLNGGADGMKCTVIEAVITSINYTFPANADCTTAWGYLGTPGVYSGGSGSGIEAWGDKGPTIQGEDVLTGSNVEGLTSATFDATIDHEEFYILGFRDPLRPASHPYTVTITLVGLIPDMSEFVSTWTWGGGGENIAVGPCTAKYCRPADGGLSADTGAIPMVTATFTGLDFSC